MDYTIQKVAKLAGITVRTLHHYDAIGLLRPSYVAGNGYRMYAPKELSRLRQILFFRELDFPLAAIREIMSSPTYEPVSVLTQQKNLIRKKIEHLERVVRAIDETLIASKGGDTMNDDTGFSALRDPAYTKYKEEAQKRWGNTPQYAQSQKRVGALTKAQFDAIKEEGKVITLAISQCLENGHEPGSGKTQQEVARWYMHLHHFYDPTPEIFSGLGEMYVADDRFRGFYEKIRPGLAEYMRDAMRIYARELERSSNPNNRE